MMYQSDDKKSFDVEQSFCECKRLAGYIALAVALALLGEIIYSNVYDGIRGIINGLYFILTIFALAAVLLAFYPVSCVEVGKNGFTYRRGKKEWAASWEEIEEIYLSQGNRDFQIKTGLGSTKLIALSVIRKKGSPSKGFPFPVNFNLVGFCKNIALHENKDGQELLSILEERSGKKAKPGIITGLEKIR